MPDASAAHGGVVRRLGRSGPGASPRATKNGEHAPPSATPELSRDLAVGIPLATERERRRIAAGLHDGVGQMLALARARLDELSECPDPESRTRTVEEIAALLDRTLDATRTLTFDLSSPVLRELGLAPALEALAERLTSRSGTRFRFEADGRPGPIDEDSSLVVYAIARELSWNVCKHAGAAEATFSLSTTAGHVRVAVEDDGVGFDPSAAGAPMAPGSGFGLFSVRQQVRSLGGRLEIDSAPGRGCRAVVTVPLAGNGSRPE